MYDCMRSSEKRKKNPYLCVCACMCVWGARANQRHTRHHRSSRLCEWSLKSVRAQACVLVLFRKSLYCVCLSAGAHRDTNTHTQATLKTQANTCQEMIGNQHFHSSTPSQYSATRNTHTHWSDESPVKTSDGRADNLLSDKSSCLYRGETES
jgi:hypothetical protein